MRRWAPLLVVIGLLAAACGGGGEKPAAKPTDAAQPPTPVFCPLTGAERPPGTELGHPAVAIKVDNIAAARPQVGLDMADIVYEELAEGGISRFIAIFHCSEAARVGPVRSARLVDLDVLPEYSPVLFGFSGANAEVLRQIQEKAPGRAITPLEHGRNAKAYERVSGRRSPHNLFTGTEKLRSLKPDVKGAPKIGLIFAKTSAPASPSPAAASPSPAAPPPPAPAAGGSVSFSFTRGGEAIRYSFDAGSKTYLRFVGDKAHSLEGGSQIKVVNVVVLKVRVTVGSIRDAAGNPSPEVAVTGSGEAIVLTNGTSVSGRWSRASLTDKTQVLDAAGQPVVLQPGNTWIHLVSDGQPVTVQ